MVVQTDEVVRIIWLRHEHEHGHGHPCFDGSSTTDMDAYPYEPQSGVPASGQGPQEPQEPDPHDDHSVFWKPLAFERPAFQRGGRSNAIDYFDGCDGGGRGGASSSSSSPPGTPSTNFGQHVPNANATATAIGTPSLFTNGNAYLPPSLNPKDTHLHTQPRAQDILPYGIPQAYTNTHTTTAHATHTTLTPQPVQTTPPDHDHVEHPASASAPLRYVCCNAVSTDLRPSNPNVSYIVACWCTAAPSR